MIYFSPLDFIPLVFYFFFCLFLNIIIYFFFTTSLFVVFFCPQTESFQENDSVSLECIHIIVDITGICSTQIHSQCKLPTT